MHTNGSNANITQYLFIVYSSIEPCTQLILNELSPVKSDYLITDKRYFVTIWLMERQIN